MSNHEALTRRRFLELFERVCEVLHINTSPLTGHSFRIGAATAAATAHIPDHIIQLLGRWKSDSYKRYIRTPKAVIQKAQDALHYV